MNKKLLFLIGAFFAMTTAVFSGNTAGGTMSIDFAALGGNYPDKTAVAISSEVATIGGTSMGTCMVGEEALDTKFVLEVGTSWLIRMTNGLNQNNSNYRAMGFRNCTANQIITIVGTGDPNPSTNATLKTQDGNTYIYTVTADGDVKFNPARHLYFTSVSVENPAATPVETPAIELTPDATGKQWSLAEMPGYDVELQVEYKTDTKVAVIYDGEAVTEDGISAYMKYEADFAGKLEAAVSELESATAVEGATVTYTSSDATVLAFKGGEEYAASGALADIAFLKEGSAELTVAYAGDADNAPASATVKVNVAWMKYSVEMSSDVEDNDKWEIVPDKAKEGTIVTATYKGNLKLKGMKAVKKRAPIDLSTLTAAYTANNGDVLTGETALQIIIPDNASVILNNATISGGIVCSGSADIVIEGENNVSSSTGAGIQAGGKGTTLTISGTGSLSAQGGSKSAGIGSGAQSSCGNIIISGGTVVATGGENAAGIGTGYLRDCDSITITDAVTRVTATSGSTYAKSIGAGWGGYCGTVTIGGEVGAISGSPYTYIPGQN